MNIKNGDIDLAKSIFTILGYMTRETIADIKTKKKVNDLEKDFLMIRSNLAKFQEICEGIPILKNVDRFSAGVEAGLLQIIHFLNTDATRDENVVERLFEEAKLVNYIILTNNLFNSLQSFNGILCRYVIK